MNPDLVIETATERSLVALISGDKTLFRTDFPFGYKSSRYLLPAIEAGFAEAGLSIQEIGKIVVGVGPGSYTGIRVGAIVAKMLAFTLNKPLIGVSSLKGFVPEAEGPFVVMIDAKISGAYLIKGEKTGEGVRYLSEPSACPIASLEKELSNIKTIVTPNAQKLRPKIEGIYQGEWQETVPDPLQMAKAALDETAVAPNDLQLLYLRKTQAELEKL